MFKYFSSSNILFQSFNSFYYCNIFVKYCTVKITVCIFASSYQYLIDSDDQDYNQISFIFYTITDKKQLNVISAVKQGIIDHLKSSDHHQSERSVSQTIIYIFCRYFFFSSKQRSLNFKQSKPIRC